MTPDMSQRRRRPGLARVSQCRLSIFREKSPTPNGKDKAKTRRAPQRDHTNAARSQGTGVVQNPRHFIPWLFFSSPRTVGVGSPSRAYLVENGGIDNGESLSNSRKSNTKNHARFPCSHTRIPVFIAPGSCRGCTRPRLLHLLKEVWRVFRPRWPSCIAFTYTYIVQSLARKVFFFQLLLMRPAVETNIIR